MERECNKFRRMLSRAVDGQLAEAERRKLDFHLAGCSSCRGELEQLQKDRLLVAVLTEVEPPPYLMPRVMATIRQKQFTGQRRLTLAHFVRAAVAVLLVSASAGSGVLLGSSIARKISSQSGSEELLLTEAGENGTVDVYSVAFGGGR